MTIYAIVMCYTLNRAPCIESFPGAVPYRSLEACKHVIAYLKFDPKILTQHGIYYMCLTRHADEWQQP